VKVFSPGKYRDTEREACGEQPDLAELRFPLVVTPFQHYAQTNVLSSYTRAPFARGSVPPSERPWEHVSLSVILITAGRANLMEQRSPPDTKNYDAVDAQPNSHMSL